MKFILIPVLLFLSCIGIGFKETTPEQQLFQATSDGNIKKAKQLISEGANINESRALIVASYRGRTELVNLLISYGADVNVKSDVYETTPLFAASEHGGRTDIMKILIQAGADPNFKDQYGRTPLYFAYRRKNAEEIRILKQAGAKELNLKQTRDQCKYCIGCMCPVE
ncbi:MAG: ankyrin repeat domain-containing protein [Leptospiraceae bacterium]|nr:ankyrin repeat domain-containing protein [Leptospiraceae bacterium]